MADPRVKQLRIKSGVLKRALKEKQVYQKELERELSRLEEMKNAERDEHDLRHQEEVIKESQMMLPDCQRRIYNAYNDLKSLLQETETDLAELEVFVQAKGILDEAVV